MGKQRYQTGRAVVLLLRHGDEDGIVRDNVLRMLCSRLFSPDLQGYLRLLRSPPDILPLCSGEHLELTRFTISAAFPHPPFPIGGIRREKGEDQVSYSPSPLAFLSFSSCVHFLPYPQSQLKLPFLAMFRFILC